MTSASKRVTQEAFDDAVKDFIESLELEPEEAVSTALEEYTMQNLDISGLDTTWPPESRKQHPVAEAMDRLRSALAESWTQVPAVVGESLELVQKAVTDKDGQAAAVLVAAGEFAMTHVMASLARVVEVSDVDAATKALSAARCLMAADKGMKREFAAEEGVKKCATAFAALGKEIAAPVARVLDVATSKFEVNKCAVFDTGLSDTLLDMVRMPETEHEAVRAAAAALGNLCLNDDTDAPGSRAFAIGIEISTKKAAPETLLDRLRAESAAQAPDERTAAALLRSLQRVCVNDEACERFAKAGGLEEALAWAAPGKDPKTALAALRALGQVAGNDGNRAALVRLGYLELVPGLVLGFFEAAGVVEAALRVLGMVLLRNPEAAEAALECGALGAAAEALGGHGGHAGVCRQVCQVVRNAVVRSPGVKEALLRVEGLETGIRAARMKHGECKDVGGAALRDLGLEYLGETEKTDGSLDYYYNAL